MCRVGAALPVNIHREIARIAWEKRRGGGRVRGDTLARAPGLAQRALHGKVLIREPLPWGIANHGVTDWLDYLVLESPLAGLVEGAGIEDGLIQTHVQKPAEEVKARCSLKSRSLEARPFLSCPMNDR